MIQIFKHRCNDLSSLQNCKPHWGVEIDLRSDINDPHDMHLSHDPWRKGESFRRWLAEFTKLGIQGPIILNTKEDGLEKLALELLKNANVESYIFLDTAFPTFRKWTREMKNPNFFVRWSTAEPLELALANKEFCQWAWVDCFDRIPPSGEVVSLLSTKFNTCLVSPELQGGTNEDIKIFSELIKFGLKGVCTKFPEVWESLVF